MADQRCAGEPGSQVFDLPAFRSHSYRDIEALAPEALTDGVREGAQGMLGVLAGREAEDHWHPLATQLTDQANNTGLKLTREPES